MVVVVVRREPNSIDDDDDDDELEIDRITSFIVVDTLIYLLMKRINSDVMCRRSSYIIP